MTGLPDVIHAHEYTLENLLSASNPTLLRLCHRGWWFHPTALWGTRITGPVRSTKNAFIRDRLGTLGEALHGVLDIGGGRGGDAHHWLHWPETALQWIHVVDPDAAALEEYARRLSTSWRAKRENASRWLLPPSWNRTQTRTPMVERA